jgi:hypothetical protein
MKHKVNMQETEEGFAVWAPGLPGGGHKAKMKKKLWKTLNMPYKSI